MFSYKNVTYLPLFCYKHLPLFEFIVCNLWKNSCSNVSYNGKKPHVLYLITYN